jgi:lysophospholipase L1-like esterase
MRSTLLLLLLLLGSVALAADVLILPFGDSITTCCHVCGVSKAILPSDSKHKAEDLQPFQGYMRPLWHTLDQLRTHNGHPATLFDFAGRQRDCLFKLANGTRASVADWPVRYEGYYGATTGQLLARNHASEAVQATQRQFGDLPRIALLHVGTNDLIALRLTNRVAAAVDSTRLLIEALAFGARPSKTRVLQHWSNNTNNDMPPFEGYNAAELASVCAALKSTKPRAIVVSLPIPIEFGLVAGAQGSYATRARRRRRTAGLHFALRRMFTELTDVTVPERPAATHSSAIVHIAALKFGKERLGEVQRACGIMAHGPWQEQGPNVALVLVDQSLGFSPNTDLHGDGLHPNIHGEAKIAARYAAAVQQLLHGWGIFTAAVVKEETLLQWASQNARRGIAEEIRATSPDGTPVSADSAAPRASPNGSDDDGNSLPAEVDDSPLMLGSVLLLVACVVAIRWLRRR